MEDELLTFDQVMGLFQISEKTLIRILAEEKIPARKLGGKWRFSKLALMQWIAEGNSQDYTRSGEGENG